MIFIQNSTLTGWSINSCFSLKNLGKMKTQNVAVMVITRHTNMITPILAVLGSAIEDIFWHLVVLVPIQFRQTVSYGPTESPRMHFLVSTHQPQLRFFELTQFMQSVPLILSHVSTMEEARSMKLKNNIILRRFRFNLNWILHFGCGKYKIG